MARYLVAGMMVAALAAGLSAQTRKPAGAKPVTYDVTITTDGTPYTGTMVLSVVGGKVSGTMNITQPTAVTGKAAGTVKAGEMSLDFPFHMVERKCDGQIAMNFKMPAKPAETKGTVSIVGCGRDASNKLPGTIELKPAEKK
jgi:hypothetical protein